MKLKLAVITFISLLSFVAGAQMGGWTETKELPEGSTFFYPQDVTGSLYRLTADFKVKMDSKRTSKQDLDPVIKDINSSILQYARGGNREQVAQFYLLEAHIYADGLNDTNKASAICKHVKKYFRETICAKQANQMLVRFGEVPQELSSEEIATLTRESALLLPASSPTDEAIEQRKITESAARLFADSNFEGMEALAEKYRSSKECQADGQLKITFVYDGFQPTDDDQDSDWVSHLAKMKNWVASNPKSATAKVALARCMVAYAWHARGRGGSSTVSQEAWKLFFSRLQQAVAMLNDAKGVAGSCPVMWQTFLRAELGLQAEKPEYNKVFQEAVKAVPYDNSLYLLRGKYLLPRWHGDDGEWQRDLTQSAESVGGEDGDMIYARVTWANDLNHESVFAYGKISWERVDKGFAAILKKHPDSVSAKNERARLACLARDKPKARKYFLDTDARVDSAIWGDTTVFITTAAWAFAE